MIQKIVIGITGRLKELAGDDQGIGVVELILILVEKRVTGNTYVLCGN